MASLFSVAPKAKRTRIAVFDISICIFCKANYTEINPSCSPNLKKLASLFNACETRNDNVSTEFLQHKEAILKGEVAITYHRNCRSTYVSSHHIRRNLKADTDTFLDDIRSEITNTSDSVFRRSQTQTSFNWKTNCFICGQKCDDKHRKTWAMVQRAISSNPDKPNMYVKILEAARCKEDNIMITRLLGVPNGDLVAGEARYHRTRNCYGKYVNPHYVNKTSDEDKLIDTYRVAVQQLISELTIPIQEKEVFLLQSLRSRLEVKLKESIGNETHPSWFYSSQRLKAELKITLPGLSFIPQLGSSDLVCSENITVGDALLKASTLVQELKAVEDDEVDEFLQNSGYVATEIDSASDDMIVHRAIGILRARISMITKPENEYYSPSEMNSEKLKEFVDPLLYKSICWLIHEDMFVNATDTSEKNPEVAALNIACDIITASNSVPSPKHLGLAVNLHHQYGSRKLIDLLYGLGYCISYTELRTFLTSASHHIASMQQPTDVGNFVPLEMKHKDDGGKLILAAADNWDHNENTTDGKNTTHAMTSILVQARAEGTVYEYPRIKRIQSRTFDATLVPG